MNRNIQEKKNPAQTRWTRAVAAFLCMLVLMSLLCVSADAATLVVIDLAVLKIDAKGLKPGDRIVTVDGTAISAAADLSTVLDQHRVGDTVKVTLSRSGKEVSVNVKPTEQKPGQ